jgi:hypothetical protein
LEGTSSTEHLYNAIDGTNNFDKVDDFLGITMAEARGFGTADYSLHSNPASGIFHFTQATEADTTKQAMRGPRPV